MGEIRSIIFISAEEFHISMVEYWAFIVRDHVYQGKTILARDVLADRVRNKFWSLNSRARNVRKLMKGDKVIFYLTSSEGKGFMGRGVLAGEAHPMSIEQRFHIIGSPSINFDYAVEFSEAEMWPRLVSINLLIDKMPLLLGRKNPVRIFRGSIIRLTEKDYNIVLETAEKLMNEKE